MLERLRMQEVSQIVLSVPEGVIIPGKNYITGEPIMIINNPALSNLAFLTRSISADDAQGHIGESGITKNMEFTINDGSILYALWSYIYGYVEENKAYTMRGIEYINVNEKTNRFKLSEKPSKLFLYKVKENTQELIPTTDYCILECETDIDDEFEYWIEYDNIQDGDIFLVSYEYDVDPLSITNIKQIHNNIICSIDIYIDAVDLKNDNKHIVCIHCDRVQIMTNLVLSINDSSKASFTPIIVKSIPEGDGIDKNVATIVVM